jgi:RNA polymerase I-specific transcription initiation factor RRN6
LRGITEGLEIAAPGLYDFLETFPIDEYEDSGNSSKLVVSNLTLYPNMDITSVNQASRLLDVYDRIADQWIASLPLDVSNLSRLAKFTVARKVAMELCLSSIAVSLQTSQNKTDILASINASNSHLAPQDEGHDRLHAESPLLSSQFMGLAQDPGSRLLTPTPSIYSHSSGVSADMPEDAAISRLRQYTTIGMPSANMNKARLLSQWPSTLGADPSEFDWETARIPPPGNDSGEETDGKKRREEHRNRKKTEKYLRKQMAESMEVISQPAFPSFGSQPDFAHHAASSQSIADISMTQPDRGLFGSRSVNVDKKRLKKRRAAGF